MANAVPTSTNEVAKQGAYGKVKIHSESLLSQLSHYDEVVTAIKYKMGLAGAKRPEPLPKDTPRSYAFCEAMLKKTSRSFCLVIQQLPWHLRKSVCVFYLVLRGLDTVEDDMVTFKDSPNTKLNHLRSFHEYIRDRTFSMDGVGEGDERTLLQSFFNVSRSLLDLPEGDSSIVTDICARMGEGMASFAGRDLREGTEDAADYKQYCYYVAGLVGEGLTRLWAVHGDEPSELVNTSVPLAIDMGLFLQKTNIIRDYLEDLVEGRAFWPKSIWKLYAPTSGLLGSLRDMVASGSSQLEDRAVACLNHLVADALTLAPSCLRYMAALTNRSDVFRFCAIPQVMAIATLAKVVHNRDVFTGVVKIRKGQALKLLVENGDMESVRKTFAEYTRMIVAAIPIRHTAAHAIAAEAAAAINRLSDGAVSTTPSSAAELKARNHRLRAAGFGCLIGGFIVLALCNAGEASASSIFSSILNIVIFLVVVVAAYAFFAAARTPRELSISGKGIASIRAPGTPQSSSNGGSGVAWLLSQP